MRLIVGLGNPGGEYKGTRHNAGFLIADALAKELSAQFRRKLTCFWAKTVACGQDIIIAKPRTYMNLSGRAVKRIRADFAVAVDEIIVVHDDADLPLGSLKIKKGGSSAGHGGIESIIQHLGDNSFARVRVGIGRDKKDLKDYVLGEFSSSEKKVLESVIDSAIKAIFTFVDKGIDETMLKFNKRMQEITNEQNSK